MARPRSEEKQQAILAAATRVIAELGVAAPTAKIAREAGIAEGSLFTYFANKDDLLNELYLALKMELRAAIMSAYPAQGGLQERARHVWRMFVGWGVAHPHKRKAVAQLAVSERVTEQTKAASQQAFGDINVMVRETVASGALRDYPPAFAAAIMESLASTTMNFMERDAAQADRYMEAGFEAFWHAVAHS